MCFIQFHFICVTQKYTLPPCPPRQIHQCCWEKINLLISQSWQWHIPSLFSQSIHINSLLFRSWFFSRPCKYENKFNLQIVMDVSLAKIVKYHCSHCVQLLEICTKVNTWILVAFSNLVRTLVTSWSAVWGYADHFFFGIQPIQLIHVAKVNEYRVQRILSLYYTKKMEAGHFTPLPFCPTFSPHKLIILPHLDCHFTQNLD